LLRITNSYQDRSSISRI